MKNNKGITLIILVIYIVVATLVISIIAYISANFYSNMNIIKDQDKYAVEFNKFNMFFINDVKSNKEATVGTTKIEFADGTTYELKGTDIYRNNVVIASQIQSANFSSETYNVPNTIATKTLINVHLTIGKKSTQNNTAGDINKNINERFDRTIQYVLKYW